MAVAPSYQKFTQMADPYMENGRMYITLKDESTGRVKKARWYTNAEYKKLYPNAPIETANDCSIHDILGFGGEDDGITLFKGDTYSELDWFHLHKECRYHRILGWYVVSSEEVPTALPKGITPVRALWNKVSGADGKLLPDAKLQPYLDSILYDESDSEYVGEIGERLELDVTVTKKTLSEGYYGVQTTHYFEDEIGNVYVWKTSAKSLAEGQSYHIKGTVKEFKTYHGQKQTWLTRCSC